MRLRAFICYGLNVQSLHRWMQVSRLYTLVSTPRSFSAALYSPSSRSCVCRVPPRQRQAMPPCVCRVLTTLGRSLQVLRQNEALAKKFFEPWSYIQSDHSMTELTQALQPLQVCDLPQSTGHTQRNTRWALACIQTLLLFCCVSFVYSAAWPTLVCRDTPSVSRWTTKWRHSTSACHACTANREGKGATLFLLLD